MSPVQPPPPSDTAGTPSVALRQHTTAPPWSDGLLDTFCLRMSSRGMCVSRALMRHDPRYRLEQLSHAHNMADDTLNAMAVQLFQHVQSGWPVRSETH